MSEESRKDSLAADYWFKVEKLYKGAKKPKTLTPPAKKNAATKDQPHLSNMTLVEGNLFKGNVEFSDGDKAKAMYYPWNGWNYIGAPTKPNRDIYKGKQPQGKNYMLYKGYGFFDDAYSPNFNPEYKRKDLNTLEIRSQLEKARQANKASAPTVDWLDRLEEQAGKNNKCGQSLPYNWEAHHMLPMSAFFRYLVQVEINVVQASDYDINSGENMIFLPAQQKFMKYHKLPGHWSDHPQYTRSLKTEFTNQIKKPIKKLKAQQKPHKGIAMAVEKNLHDMEDDCFDRLVKLGPTRLL